MEYRLKVNGETLPVEVENSGQDKLTAVIDATAFDVGYTAVSDHQVHLNVNGQGVNAYVAEQNNGKIIVIRGKTYFVQDADLAEQTRTRKKGPGSDPTEVTPPMPSVVIAVKVAAGDVVVKGQTVVIVSAMKMETSLVAPFDGTVTRVNVVEGDKVMPGNILVDIEKTGLNEEDGIP